MKRDTDNNEAVTFEVSSDTLRADHVSVTFTRSPDGVVTLGVYVDDGYYSGSIRLSENGVTILRTLLTEPANTAADRNPLRSYT